MPDNIGFFKFGKKRFNGGLGMKFDTTTLYEEEGKVRLHS